MHNLSTIRNSAVAGAVILVLLVGFVPSSWARGQFSLQERHERFELFITDVDIEDSETRKVEKPSDFALKSKLLTHFRLGFEYDTRGSPKKETAAGGGWITYKMPWWKKCSLGLTTYIVEPLMHDPMVDAQFLRNGTRGYGVLGEAYVKAYLPRSKTKFNIFRLDLGPDNPMLNTGTLYMTPLTYEAYVVENRDLKDFTFTAGAVTRIKGYTNTKFLSLSDYAGKQGFGEELNGTRRPIIMNAIEYRHGKKYKLQAWNYFCPGFMNTVYMEGNAKWNLPRDFTYTLWLQGYLQNDVGESLGGKINTGMWGGQTSLGWKGLDFYLAYSGIGSQHELVIPWSSYNGYTAPNWWNNIQAGAQTWLVGGSYKLKRTLLKGLSSGIYHTNNHAPDNLGRWETYWTMQYTFDDRFKIRGRALLKGLSLIVKLSRARQQGYSAFTDTQMFVNYQLSIF